MATWYRLFFVFLLAGMAQAGGVFAQVPNGAELNAEEVSGHIQISIDLDIGGVLPEHWVGWVVDRTTLNPCQDVVQIGEVTPFPVGIDSWIMYDSSAVFEVTYKYRIFAVDAQDVRYNLPSYTEFPPSYYFFDYASVGDGVVAIGTLNTLGHPPCGITMCPEMCFEYISFISNLPSELLPLIDTPVVIQLHGEIDAEFEGPYITEVTNWSISSCGEVSNEQKAWGNLKAFYR
ncbi:MAG: hypothetical protein KOO60_13870 [Gemmatimonadales bacterium]|nr:hypothetical protein [Gemmatimonadales bacterium]